MAEQREARLVLAAAGGELGLSEGGGAALSKASRAKKRQEWLALGEELVMLGMTDEQEAGLSEQVLTRTLTPTLTLTRTPTPTLTPTLTLTLTLALALALALTLTPTRCAAPWPSHAR